MEFTSTSYMLYSTFSCKKVDGLIPMSIMWIVRAPAAQYRYIRPQKTLEPLFSKIPTQYKTSTFTHPFNENDVSFTLNKDRVH